MRTWLVVLAVVLAGCTAVPSEDDQEPPAQVSCEACLPSCGYPAGCTQPKPAAPGNETNGGASNGTAHTPAPASANPASSTESKPGTRVRVQAPDPLALGPLDWTRQEYDFGLLLVDDPDAPGYQYPVEVTGSVHSPDEGGPAPLLLFMHGRHGTCSVAGTEIIFTHVCPNAGVVSPVDSYAGYDYAAENFASHGYVVVSINANQINDRDLLGDAGAQARGKLLLRTLEEFQSVNDTGAGTTESGGAFDHLQGRIDFERIGVMGHSRGGQGIVRGAQLNEEREAPFAIRALFTIAPTDFDRYIVPPIPFATILPYCDGDVRNLQGAWMFDHSVPGTAPRVQYVALGANHNWFNTVWTGSDKGGSDPHCGSAAESRYEFFEQLRMGLAAMGSFFRAFVGEEPGFIHQVTGIHALHWDDVLLSYQPASEDVLWIHIHTLEVGKNQLGGENSLGPALNAEHCMGDDCLGTPDIGAGGFWQWTWDDPSPENRVWQANFPPHDLRAYDAMCVRYAVVDDIEQNAQGQPIRFALLSKDATGTVVVENLATALPPGEADAKTIGSHACALLSDFAVPLDAIVGASIGFQQDAGAVKTDEWFFAKQL